MRDQILAIWTRTTEAERQAGLRWYPDARAFCDSLAFWTDKPLSVTTAVTAALSPQVSWENNIEAATLFFQNSHDIWRTGVLPYSVKKATRIASGACPGATAFPLSSAPKTNNFYHNILNPDDARYVTIDRHAARAAGIDTARSLKPALYWSIAAAYKTAAASVGMVPCAFQAVIWNYVRKRGQYQLFN